MLRGHGAALRALALSADGRRHFSVSADKTVRVWDYLARHPGSASIVVGGHDDRVVYLFSFLKISSKR
ncbi:MAG: hypothetical protein V3V08_21300 [Nannocystaceae bacterium]